MADQQETQEERDARWAAYRADRVAQQQKYQTARARARKIKALVGGVIVIIVALIIIGMLL